MGTACSTFRKNKNAHRVLVGKPEREKPVCSKKLLIGLKHKCGTLDDATENENCGIKGKN
jgi:hypothetical protein